MSFHEKPLLPDLGDLGIDGLGIESLVPMNDEDRDAFFPFDGVGIDALESDPLDRLFDGTYDASPDSTRVSGGGSRAEAKHHSNPSASNHSNHSNHSPHSSNATPATSETLFLHTPEFASTDESLEQRLRRQARMKKNRENAQLSRIRKKQQLETLEETVRDLAKQNTELNVFVQRLAAENFLLRDHLKEVCGRAKVAVPDVPSVLDEVSNKSRGDVEGDVVGVHVDKTTTGTTTGTTTATTRTSKRKRGGISSGATTAFLALFALFLFASPTAFLGDEREDASLVPFVAPTTTTSRMTAASTGLVRSGRDLLSLQHADNYEDLQGNPSDPPTLITSADFISQTLDTLLLDQAPLELPKHALAVAKDLAPSALVLDDPESSSSSLPASTIFPALADRFFASSGLAPPQTCKKVFEFTAEDLSMHGPINKKSVENFVLGTTVGFKGRSTGLRIDGSTDRTSLLSSLLTEREGQRERVSFPDSEGEETKALALKNDHDPLPSTANTIDAMNAMNAIDAMDAMNTTTMEPSLVSVLLPQRAVAATDHGNTSEPGKHGHKPLTAVDELYVVVLNPQRTFSTYACSLATGGKKGALIV